MPKLQSFAFVQRLGDTRLASTAATFRSMSGGRKDAMPCDGAAIQVAALESLPIGISELES